MLPRLLLAFLVLTTLEANIQAANYGPNTRSKARLSLRSKIPRQFDWSVMPAGLVNRARSRVTKRQEQRAEEAAAKAEEGAAGVQERDHAYSRREPYAGMEAKHARLPNMRLNPGIAGPCSLVECPKALTEVRLKGIRAVARKYPVKKWATVHKDSGKFTNDDGNDYKDAFTRIMKYRTGDNFMETRIPITTPIVTELQMSGRLPSGSSKQGGERSKTFKYGFKVRYYLHSSVQSDPFLEPTDEQMQVESWSPTTGRSEWVVVFQWRTPPITKTEVQDHHITHPDEIRIRFVEFTDKMNVALSNSGRSPVEMESFYYAMYGSPVDRVHEIWVVAPDDAVQTLRGM